MAVHGAEVEQFADERLLDRKSTRLNSSHLGISYAVFCLKKKKHKIDEAHQLSARQYFVQAGAQFLQRESHNASDHQHDIHTSVLMPTARHRHHNIPNAL